ncbi:hypothetical protein [Sphingomonas daechungensis]|uniref:hypothetical protein n=1 Tax=Sphingomonas daechungensis TaxID=1176646 RepID=UPI0037850D2C
MLLLSILLTQVASAAPREVIDLTIPQPCVAAPADGEVVVCANRNGESPYRLRQPRGKVAETDLPKAEVQVANGVAIAGETEQADVGGFPSNRAMIKLKIKF